MTHKLDVGTDINHMTDWTGNMIHNKRDTDDTKPRIKLN